MSDQIITLIPSDPSFVPSGEAQEAAAALLREVVPKADEIASEVDDLVQFRDCGENFERVSCPRCGHEFENEIWGEWMSADYSDEGGFALRPFATPCCGANATLNDLKYEWPQGFSRYSIRAVNPARRLAESEVQKLEVTLGCKLRLIDQAI